MKPMAASAWLTMPAPETSDPCLTSIVINEVMTTVDMNLGR